MTMDQEVARLRIGRDLRDAEAKLDAALLSQSALLTTLVTARSETESEPFLGHEALLRLTKSQQALLDAGGELARVHGQLKGIQKEQAGFDDCPPNEPMITGDGEYNDVVARTA
ncbi:hypothetical protein [Qipengyuania sp. DGS5-3]|uniref:hypothetical protein n=1 Tax=Qipengyuania sp. DGS5-3 TaxID=3349632 RepID=UPI0036D24708